MSLFVMECLCGGELFEEVDDPEEAEYFDYLFKCTTCGEIVTVAIDHSQAIKKAMERGESS